MGKKNDGEAASFVPTTGVPLFPVNAGLTGFPQFPSGLMSRTIVSPYPLFYLPPPAKKIPTASERGRPLFPFRFPSGCSYMPSVICTL